MAPFSKPETVLKQAEGLVSVGQTHAALQSLTEMFSSKRFRSTPLTSLEPIMFRFIELCVDMRKGRTAKEGLMQYKNIAQNTSVASIENVIMKFVQLADAKVREAQEKAAVQSAVDVDDLEASETPESILLGAVSGDQSKDRTDRALVTPWLKFLWESYRTSLETLKNNARLETIYQQIAQQAFKFCLKYERKVEFRRLCETLRLHLANVAKYSHQQHSINLSDPETLQHHLDTRFAQLNTSVELELWQEAFRSVEDVHNLLTLAKKAPRPAMMANYYEKLTKIFLMSGNALFHAAAWGRYYGIVTSIGGKSEEEMKRLAGQVLVSALAVPVGIQGIEPEELKGKNARLTALLGLTRMPSRAGLLQDALARNVLKLSPEPVKHLYNVLEVTFDPLTLCSNVAPLFKNLAEDVLYSSYLPLLQRALLSRLISQLSQVYTTINISNLLALAVPLKEAGLEGAYDAEQVEAYFMGCARRGELNIRVDHKEGTITFADDAFGSADEPVASTSSLVEKSIQPSNAELVRTRLSKVATCLYASLENIEGSSAAVPSKEEQQAQFKGLVAAVEGERKALQLRRALVARRRELLSELSVRKEKEESSKRAEANRKAAEEEAKRVKEELRKREIEKTKREIDEIKAEEAKKYAQTLVDKGILKATEVEKLDTYDTEGLITIQVAQLEKEKKEMNERLRIISKRIDHIERAYRKEERPLLAQDYEEQQKTDRETFVTVQVAHREAAKRGHEEDLAAKARLSRIVGDYEAHRDKILQRKDADYNKKLAAAAKKIEEEKEKRRKAVLKERAEEQARLDKEEEEERKREEEENRREAERLAEEERLQQEEEERAQAAEEEKRKAEEAAAAIRKQRDLERAEAAERQRLQIQREEEALARQKARAEEREREKLAARRAPVAAPTAVRAPAPAAREEGGGVWRRPPPAAAAAPPARSESPAAGAAPQSKFKPGALGGGGGGGWRSRMEAKTTPGSGGNSGANTPRAGSPAPGPPAKKEEQARQDDDGFTTVAKPAVWKPRRGGKA
ncbi:hypothetical protein FA15DRAFT_622403 [Coprinopsis marcescibilis]|uniref:Eukaryotic translation initiation factor 3 subunit A n=1 Tax=Coprinopsis marcescibilis TaxID=230819 RepID=A0A5C3KRR2_COPMA|nr:hypothetical protein FA15DRAFT_622403 [Coprinopsis marcescibilis]